MKARKACHAVGVSLLVFLSWIPQGSALTADTTVREVVPTEIYGDVNAPIGLRLGNGGAGPTGLLRALAEDFIELTGRRFAVAWYQNITRLTLENLRQHVIDVALTYEPEREEVAVAEGWASHHLPVFNDHFLIVGPPDNPAQLNAADTPEDAFAKIAALAHYRHVPVTALFLSRDDHSGTNAREHELWEAAQVRGWDDPACPWYVRYHVFPAQALVRADEAGLYTLTDHGTWLSMRERLRGTQVFVRGGSRLLNPCHALLWPQPRPEAVAFRSYLASPRAQALIATFGCTRYNGQPLFTPAHQQEFVQAILEVN